MWWLPPLQCHYVVLSAVVVVLRLAVQAVRGSVNHISSSVMPTWKPDTNVVRWAWVFTITLAAGSWIGALGVLFSSYTVVAWSIVLCLPIALVSSIAFWMAVGRATDIPLSVKRQLRRNLLLLGGVVALQVLLFNYFPNSSFSGLKGCANDRCP